MSKVDQETVDKLIADNLEGMMNMVALLEANILAAKSYREKCEAQGFSETASEAMAMQFHAKILLGDKL